MYWTMTAITLRTAERGEYDRLADVLSREYGKVRIILPGVRRIKAKLATAVEPLRESRLLGYTAGNWRLFPEGIKLTGAELLNGNWHFLKSPKLYLWAIYLADITNALLGYNLANAQQYELFRRTLELLPLTEKYWRIANAYLLRLAKTLGYNFWEYITTSRQELAENANQVKEYQTRTGKELLRLDEKVLPLEMAKKIFSEINKYLEPHLWYKLKSLDVIYENFSGNNF